MLKDNQAEFDLTNVSVWQKDNLGEGVHIVVLDEGERPFDYMKNKITVLYADDDNETGHGSAILATGYQLAPNANVVYMPFNSVGSELKLKMIDWIIEHKHEIDLITMSISYNSITFKRFFSEVIKLGIPFFSPTGNEYEEDGVDTPAKYPETIAVGSYNEKLGHVDGYSNQGKEVDCVAPSHIAYLNSRGEIVKQSGTSISTPFVAYAMALYISWRKRNALPKLTNDDVRKFIKENVKDLYEEGHDYRSGYGLFKLPSKIPSVEVKEPEPIEEQKEGDLMIIDISHHQDPNLIDYDKLAKEVDFVIIRTQYGSSLIDRHYKTHHAEFRKRGIPTGAYAWVRGTSMKDMEQEATDFYNRTKDLKPTFWFLDVEEKSMNDMRAGISAYVNKLRELGAKKIGVYIAHHLYTQFNLDLTEFDAVWIPHYGINNGLINSEPSFACDIHQFTSTGRLDGYNGNLDLNTIISDKSLSYFTGGAEMEFKDIKTHWAKDYIDYVVDNGLMKGYEEGETGPKDDTFRPDAPVTRAELATVVARLNGYKEEGK